MLTKKVEEILNVQIQKEGYSSQLYLAMASWAEVNGYAGISSWFYIQSNEERLHMLKLVKYVNERGGKAIVPVIDQPPVDYADVISTFKKVLEHEEFISNSINEIVAVCLEVKDFTTHNWIQWFVNEQIEEEASVRAILDKLHLVGDHNMYIFDRDIMAIRSAASAGEGA